MNVKNTKELGLKKRHLDFLYHDVGKQSCDFRLCTTWQDSKGEVHFSKWRNYLDAQNDDDFISRCNQREQLLNEIVLDLDHGDFFALINKLKEDTVEFFAFQTKSGRARHIHTFWRGLIGLPKHERQEVREMIIKKYRCDTAFKIDSHMIPIEFCLHWKTGEIKQLVAKNGGEYDE